MTNLRYGGRRDVGFDGIALSAQFLWVVLLKRDLQNLCRGDRDYQKAPDGAERGEHDQKLGQDEGDGFHVCGVCIGSGSFSMRLASLRDSRCDLPRPATSVAG
jgi:hypothetical protein